MVDSRRRPRHGRRFRKDRDRVTTALGESNDLLTVTLEITSRIDAEAAVRAAVDRFGRIDVLVNNAASFCAGYFVARAMVTIAGRAAPPRRFIASADALAPAEQKVVDLQAQIESNRNLATSLAFD